jgi:hypothetical protein
MKGAFFIGMGLLLGVVAMAQSIDEARMRVAELLESLSEKELVASDYSELMDDLIDLYNHPLNLNKVSKEELEQLPFLSDYQIENLLFYVYNNGPLQTLYELSAVEDLDKITIQQILPFVTVAPIQHEKTRREMAGHWMVRGQTTLQEPVGYKPSNDTLPPYYLGSRERFFSRLQMQYGKTFSAGCTVEKDPGEQLFVPDQGFDFMSAYLLYKPKKWLNKVILGDYQASFGQGLGMWSGLAFSKGNDAHQIRRRARQLDKYSSVNENSYLRGLAMEMKLRKLRFYVFGSYRRRDATLVDSTHIASLREDGYHRTVHEQNARNQAGETVYGLVTSYMGNRFQVETGITHWVIDKELVPGFNMYQLYQFSGSNQTTGFMSYNRFGRKLMLFGEVAMQGSGHWAVYQGLSYSPGGDVQLAISYRHYDATYFNAYANPFSESSNYSGESGLYLGLSCQPFKQLQVSSYMDVFWYSWLRYRTDAPSYGYEFLGQARYVFQNNTTLTVRLKSNERQVNKTETDSPDFPVVKHQTTSVRGQINFQPSDSWWFQTRVEHVFFNEEKSHSSTGFLIYQDVKHTFLKSRLTIGMRLLHFDSEDYDSRIYAWEPDVLHAFSIPAFSGNGSRWLLNVSFKPLPRMQLWARWARTLKPESKEIGSGNNTVSGNHLDEFKLQLKYRF